MIFTPSRLLLTVDLAGTLLFAIEGALAAVAASLDLFGVMVLAFATALVGGIIRDVLIGAVPPSSLRDWRYPAAAFVGGAIVFFLHPVIRQVPVSVIVTLDAAALALFAVAGTEKALVYKMHPLVAALLGTITGVGGGTARDIMLAQVPAVLRADVYASAALAGAVVMIVATKLRLPSTLAAVLGGFVCFSLRVISVWQHWSLPKAIGSCFALRLFSPSHPASRPAAFISNMKCGVLPDILSADGPESATDLNPRAIKQT
jgi:uncharacterized membrane protein YeiH